MENLITNYTGKISTETAGLELNKMYWNSVLSTVKAKYMAMDISNMYLNTPLDCFKYMRMPLTDIPQEIIDEYNISDIVNPHGWIYMEIRKSTIWAFPVRRSRRQGTCSRSETIQILQTPNHGWVMEA